MISRLCTIIIFILGFGVYRCFQKTLNQSPFPDYFQFGVSTASYQIEGAWNHDGKGENIWDYLIHNNASYIIDGSNADIACDSYNKYREDVQLIKSLGVQTYRFSLSWSRILPTGYPNYINQAGIRYYNKLINELIANDIEPMITIYHWDLPQPLQKIGGWPNPVLAEHFVNFARIAFENFGDRVKKWITINEPMQICKMGYGDTFFAPAYLSSGIADYMCAYTVTRAHSLAYHLYNNTLKPIQKGQIGYSIHSLWFEPNTTSKADIEATERAFEFYTGMFANPIFGNGDWPDTVKENIKKMSFDQRFLSSRLREFTKDEIQHNSGTADFFGLNYYFAATVSSTNTTLYPVSWDNDGKFLLQWELAFKDQIESPALRKILNKLRDKYGDVPIILTENGVGTSDTLNDYIRANYFLVYLEECLDAIYEDRINLVGYIAWSLLDNFEWSRGYTVRYGIHHVDFNDPKRRRTRKYSANVYEKIVKKRKLPAQTVEYNTDSAPHQKTIIALYVAIVISIIVFLYEYF